MATKKSEYRLRVYKTVDGVIELVFGNDPVTDETWTLLSDQDVKETIETTPHVG